MEQKKRSKSIDFLRGLAIIMMVLIHLPMYLTINEHKASPIYSYLSFIGLFPAALFLFIVGISLVISTKHHERKKLFILKRGFVLILIGLLFINFWNADILHYIGIFIIISLFFTKTNKLIRFTLAILIIASTPLILQYINYYSTWDQIPYTIKNLWTLKGFFLNLFFTGFYPLFPWISFVLLGTVFGEYFLNSTNNQEKDKFFINSFLFGTTLLIIALILQVYFKQEFNIFPTTISYLILATGTCTILLAFSKEYFETERGTHKYLEPIIFLGKIALSIYVIHILVGIGYFYLTDSLNSLNLYLAISYSVAFLVITSAILYIWTKKFHQGPLEYLIKRFL